MTSPVKTHPSLLVILLRVVALVKLASKSVLRGVFGLLPECLTMVHQSQHAYRHSSTTLSVSVSVCVCVCVIFCVIFSSCISLTFLRGATTYTPSQVHETFCNTSINIYIFISYHISYTSATHHSLQTHYDDDEIKIYC